MRWQRYLNASKVKTSADSSLQCHSKQKQRADRQKIQMNALFLPGLERSWWRGVLSRSCWLLATWDCSTVQGHRVCCIGRIKLLMVSLWCKPRWVFVTVPPEPSYSFELPSHVSHLHLNHLFRSDIQHWSIWFWPGVQHRLLKSTLIG